MLPAIHLQLPPYSTHTTLGLFDVARGALGFVVFEDSSVIGDQDAAFAEIGIGVFADFTEWVVVFVVDEGGGFFLVDFDEGGFVGEEVCESGGVSVHGMVI